MNPPISRRTLLAAGIGAVCATQAKSADEKPAPKPAADRDSDAILEAALEKYNKAKEGLQKDYRTALAEAVAKADKVQACLLDFEPSKELALGDDWEHKDWFPILPYKTKTKILKQVELNEAQIKEASRVMASTIKSCDPGGGAMCHFPIHGLRFFQGESLFFLTSCCWVCHNFYVVYPDDFMSGDWLGFGDDGLEKWMKALLPIPDAELKRFREKYPSGPK